MKRAVLSSVAIGMGLAAVIYAHPASADPSVQLFTSIGPARVPFVDGTPGYEETSSNFSAYESNVITGLEAGGQAVGPSYLPSSFIPTAQTSFSYTDIIGTAFHSWMGDSAPTGVYANEYGTFLRTSVLVSSSQPFTLNDVYESYSDPNGAVAAQSIAAIEQGYGEQAFGGDVFGLSYGPDGKPGGGDDVFYGAGSTATFDTTINQLYYFGSGYENYICPQVCLAGEGSPQAFYADIGSYIGSIQPYSISDSFTLNQAGVNVASATFDGQITVPVSAAPEASTWLLMLAGIGGVGLMLRQARRKSGSPFECEFAA